MNTAERILVVDDIETNRVLLGAFVTQMGYHPLYAKHGREALGMMRVEKVDLVLLDMMMPEMNGLEFLARFREVPDWSHIPVVVVSSQDEIEGVVRCIEAGALDYIVKPCDPVLLRARLTSSLARKAAADRERAYQQEIAQKNRELVEKDRLKDKFFQIATHDLRSPLSSIRLTSYLLAEDLQDPERSEKWRGRLKRIEQLIDRGLGLIDDFLDFKVIQSGRVRLEKMSLDLNGLVTECIESHGPRAQEKAIELALEAAPENARVDVDRARFIQVLANYLENAVKFSERGSRITVRTRLLEGSARVEVQDEGPGVREDERPQLFMEFARISNQPTGGERSTGLGLCIIKQLVELHGGRVGADFPARGSIFWLELPLAPGET